MKTLTQERLLAALIYDPMTGIFTRRVGAGGSKANSVAGSPSHGYSNISIDGKIYGAHRLAWLYVHGNLPLGDVDHIDGNRSNNTIANLRDVSRSVNLQNSKEARKNNKSSGMLGVSWLHGKWQAKINIGGYRKHIGMFKTPELAHAAYLEEKRIHHQGNTL